MDDERDPSETTRLLESHPAPSSSSNLPKPPSALHCILAAAAVQMLLSVGSDIALAPQTDILQGIVCKNYYSDYEYSNAEPTTFDRCKAEPIQAEVAYINAWANALETIPSILLAVPFGVLADRIGRKTVLLIAIFGLFMNDVWIRIVYWFPNVFPVRAVWLAGLWQMIGAGPATLQSLIFVLVADACSADQRTAAFSQIKSARLVSQLIFIPAGGALISINPWIPMFISSGFMIVGFCVAVFAIPKTSYSAVPVAASGSESEDAQGLLPGENHGDSPKTTVRHRLREHVTQLADVGPLLVKNARLIPILLSFFAFQVGEQAGRSLLLQYAAKRLDWTIGKASYLISIRAGVNIVVLALLIPAISIFITRRLHLHALVKDKLLAQGSGAFLVIGSGTVFLATSWVIFALGQVLCSLGDVFALPARSIATSLVDQSHLGTLYTAIEVVTYGGILVGGPLLGSAFRWGMQLGDFWMGLPFLFAAGFFLLALLALTVAAARRGGQSQQDTGTAVDRSISGDGVTSEEYNTNMVRSVEPGPIFIWQQFNTGFI